jgi:hypothetical protein
MLIADSSLQRLANRGGRSGDFSPSLASILDVVGGRI